MSSSPTTTSASFLDLYRSVVARHADRLAIEDGNTSLAYADLDRRANRIAHALLASGDRTPVVMVAPIAAHSIIGMLGTLKTGRVFVPVDPREPPARVERLRSCIGPHTFLNDAGLTHDRDDDPGLSVDAEHPSIVFFTSGSSGEPRAVVKSHEQLAHPAAAHRIATTDRCALILPPAFGGSIVLVFGSLLNGAALCLFDPIGHGTGTLARWISETGVTVLQTAPSTLGAIAKELVAQKRSAPSVQQIILGGESCRGADVGAAWRVMPAATVINHYGATETGAIAFTRITPGSPVENGSIAFRDLYPEQTIDFVDEEGHPVAGGEVGRLQVSSRRVALGYWNDEAAGGPPFVAMGDGTRSIVLGDLARRRDDDALEIVGRADLRVKINGQTADPEVVERALETVPGISFAFVAPVDDRNGGKRLVAYIGRSGESWPVVGEIRKVLARSLPAFLIPSVFFRIRAVPRNARGKVDRELLRQLPPDLLAPRPPYVAPRTPIEKALAELVSEAVGLAQIGVLDDVFELGIDSLTMMDFLIATNARFDQKLTPPELLEHATIENVARLMTERKRESDRAMFELYRGGSGDPLFCLPGGGGGRSTFTMRQLSRRVGRPAFSFLPRGFNTRGRPDRSVERLAARYVNALRTFRPGPYLLAGFSFGGLVAYEMARQLEAADERVAMLALIDPTALRPRRLRRHVETAIQELADERIVARGRLEWMTRRIRGWITDRSLSVTAGLLSRAPEKRDAGFFRLNIEMASRYEMKPYGGPIVLIRGDEWHKSDMFDYTKCATGQVDVRRIHADHRAILREPYLSQVASILRNVFAQATGEAPVS